MKSGENRFITAGPKKRSYVCHRCGDRVAEAVELLTWVTRPIVCVNCALKLGEVLIV